MTILRTEDVQLKGIEERFEEKGGKYHYIRLGCPDIGRDWQPEDFMKLHIEDWRIITSKIRQDYSGTDYDLIIASAYVSQRTVGRAAECWTNFYKMK